MNSTMLSHIFLMNLIISKPLFFFYLRNSSSAGFSTPPPLTERLDNNMREHKSSIMNRNKPSLYRVYKDTLLSYRLAKSELQMATL